MPNATRSALLGSLLLVALLALLASPATAYTFEPQDASAFSAKAGANESAFSNDLPSGRVLVFGEGQTGLGGMALAGIELLASPSSVVAGGWANAVSGPPAGSAVATASGNFQVTIAAEAGETPGDPVTVYIGYSAILSNGCLPALSLHFTSSGSDESRSLLPDNSFAREIVALSTVIGSNVGISFAQSSFAHASCPTVNGSSISDSRILLSRTPLLPEDPPTTLPLCGDAMDNDGDSLIDLADPRDCRSFADVSEGPDCSDDFDNDGDGLVDLADGGCTDAADFSEEPDCEDGLSNDADVLVDHDGGVAWGLPAAQQTAPDADCAGEPSRTSETVACGNGALDPGEQCDDANTSGGDCCTPTCQYASLSSCRVLNPTSQTREAQVSAEDRTTGFTCFAFVGGRPAPSCPVTLGLVTPAAHETAADFLPFTSDLSLPAYPGHEAHHSSELGPSRFQVAGSVASSSEGSFVSIFASAGDLSRLPPFVPPYLALDRAESGVAESLLDLRFEIDADTRFAVNGVAERFPLHPFFGLRSDFRIELTRLGVGPMLSYGLEGPPCPLEPPFPFPPPCGIGPVSIDESGALPAGSYRLEVELSNSSVPVLFSILDNISYFQGDTSGSFDLSFEIARPPVANAGPDQLLECTSPAGTALSLDGSASSDPNDDALDYSWTGSFGSASGPAPDVSLVGLGSQSISLALSDGETTITDSLEVTVQDTTAPVAEALLEPVFQAKKKRKKKSKKASGYVVRLSCTDLCDPAAEVDAMLEGIPVSDGDFFSAKALKKLRKKKASKGSRRAPPRLSLVCTDASGNRSEDTAFP